MKFKITSNKNNHLSQPNNQTYNLSPDSDLVTV